MNSAYTIRNLDSIYSPALVFYKDLIRSNIAEIVRIANGPAGLRPHVKTHKTREIVRLEIDAGITKHKCATLAEAEMLAQAGALDVLIAYPIVGPNGKRLAALMMKYPTTRFSALVDHPQALTMLGQIMAAEGLTLDALIDLNVGQHRTGIEPGDEARALYRQLATTPGLRTDGFHVYDGHNHQESESERKRRLTRCWRLCWRCDMGSKQKGSLSHVWYAEALRRSLSGRNSACRAWNYHRARLCCKTMDMAQSLPTCVG